jgi:hypothetical protein
MNLNMIRKLPSDQNFNRKLQLSDPNYDERGRQWDLNYDPHVNTN